MDGEQRNVSQKVKSLRSRGKKDRAIDYRKEREKMLRGGTVLVLFANGARKKKKSRSRLNRDKYGVSYLLKREKSPVKEIREKD